MPKIIINDKQYAALLLREQKLRLNDITEDLTKNEVMGVKVLEEGYKEVILGVAMLLSQALGGKVMAQTGHNKEVAEKALQNQQIMGQIKATLEDENKTQELVNAMEQQGLKNPDIMLANNAKKITDQFNKIANDNKIKYHLDTKAVTNLQSLDAKLKQGYALQKKSTDTTSKENSKEMSIISVTDTLVIEFGSHNLFGTGGFKLSQSGNDTIKATIDEIKKQNGKILSVNVESSTDAEEIVQFITDTDPTGNIKLAELRSNSVITVLDTMVKGATITHREIPNNGYDVVSTKEFLSAAKDKEATDKLREKTNKFRYIKISIVATFESKPESEKDSIESAIKNYRFELVKVIMESGKKHKIKVTPRFHHKKFKCRKSKGQKGAVQCATF